MPVRVDSPAGSEISKRLDGIDLLRGLAIFLVLMNHINMRLLRAKIPYTKSLPPQLVHVLVWNGQLGVQIFFAVSGFLITFITLQRWKSLRSVNPASFYRFRFARIAPLLLLLLAILSAFHFAHVDNFVVTAKTGGLGRALLAALTIHVNLLEASHGYLPPNWDVLWSLSVEEMFYLFFPLACAALGRGKLLVALLLSFVVLGPFGRTVLARGNEIWHEYSYLGGMEAIAMGCLTALIVSKGRFSQKSIKILGISGTSIIALSLIFSWENYSNWFGRAGLDMTVLAFGTCLFIAATTQLRWKSPRFLKPLLRTGQLSYEIYLTHMFVVLGFFTVFLGLGTPMPLVPALFIVTILAAVALGATVARFYSEPMNQMLRRPFVMRDESLATPSEAAKGEPA